MNTTKTLAAGMALAFAWAGWSSDVPSGVAGYGEFAVTNVTAAMTADGRLVSSDGGVIAKCGAGTWNVPKGFLDQAFPFTVQVLEGVWAFSSDAVPVQGNPVPAVMAKASLWVAADDVAGHFIAKEGTSTGEVARWLDVRETDADNPTHQYAQANYAYFDAKSLTRQAPVKTTYDSKDALHFGTAGSGVTMTILKPDGTTLKNDVTTRSVFLVLGIDKSVGFPVGGDKTANFSYLWTGAAQYMGKDDYTKKTDVSVFYSAIGASEKEQAFMQQARVYRNGSRINPFYEKFARGIDVWSVLMNEQAIGVNALFNDRDVVDGDTMPRAGGDYLHEAVVFTNVLTEAERVQVTGYLVRKWRSDLAATDERHVGVAADAVARLAGDGATTAHFALSGEGAVEQVAGQALSLKPDAAGFFGTVTLADGTDSYLRGPIPVKAVAGRRVTVTAVAQGLNDKTVQTATERDGRFVKAGVGDLTVNALDADIRKIEVAEGRLALLPPTTSETVPGEDAVVEVEHGDFETGWDRTKAYESYKGPSGWTVDYRSGFGSMYVLELGAAGLDYAAAPGNSINPALRAPKGNGVMLFTSGSGISKSVTFARAGRYQLDVRCASTRNTFCLCDVSLTDGAQTERKIGQFTTPYKSDAFATRTIRFEVATAGTYTLRFGAAYLDYANYGVILDDVSIRRVAPRDAAEWQIPGGDFEMPSWGLDERYATSSTHAKVKNAPSIFNVSNVVAGWTFVQQSGFDPTAAIKVNRPGVGIATAMMPTHNFNLVDGFWTTDPAGIYFNFTRPEETGACELLFTTDGAKAVTTFRPPAGTWQLKGLMAHSLKGKGGLKATVTLGASGPTVELGTIKPTYQASSKGLDLQERHWPGTFVADGNTDVTLTLESTGCGDYWGPVVDNLVLTRRHSLIRNGSFELETGTSGSSYTDWEAFAPAVGDKSSTAERQLYTYQADHMGYDVCDGLWRLHLVLQGGMRQQVAFPEAGDYRLSFWAHARSEPDYPTWRTSKFDGGPIRAWFVPDGSTATNVIMRTNPLYNDRFAKFETVFHVDTPTSGTFGIHIDGVWPNDSQVDDIRLERVLESGDTDVADGVAVSVADGAKLVLPFDGTLSVGRFYVNGAKLAPGTYSAATCAAIEGVGSLCVTGKGTPGFVFTVK